MPELVVDDRHLRVELARWERVASMHGSFAVELELVAAAEPVATPLAARRGVRVLGTWVPGVLAYGTYRYRGRWDFVAVHRWQAGLRLTLVGARFGVVLVSVAEPEGLSTQLAARAR